MAADRFSPVAPAQVRVLVLPVGTFERSRFLSFVQRLRREASVIALRDLQPYVQDDELLLSPKAFPQGIILYNYTTALPSEQQQKLSPFELFREPLLVLGLKDGAHPEQGVEEQLHAAAERLREQHPRVVHRQLMVWNDGSSEPMTKVDGVVYATAAEQHAAASLQLAAQEFTACFLAGLSTYARAMQASPGIQTPGQTARSLQRVSLQKEAERLPASARGTPPQPTDPSSPAKSAEDFRSNPPPSKDREPSTSLELIGNPHGSPTRPDSRASNAAQSSPRPSSQDASSMQGFGSVTSQDKLKSRGKARVGIVMGSIQMLAGQWSEALRMFIEHTSKARVLADSLWHAKGLEGIVVCLLLTAWAGLDFTIPSLCYPVADRSTAAHIQRFSVNLPSDFRMSLDGQSAPVTRLAAALPELLKFILSLYHSIEGSLELPFVSMAEATIRFCRLLAILHTSRGTLGQETLRKMFMRVAADRAVASPTSGAGIPGDLFKGTITDLLSGILPHGDDNIPVSDQIGILAGISSVYSMAGMSRKEAVTMRDLLARLTSALITARKRGAAEMGIHPAASLSVDTGATSILTVAEESGELSQTVSELAANYGVLTTDPSDSGVELQSARRAGNESLRLEIMKALAAFCEAVPYSLSVLHINASILRAFGPIAAVDSDPFMTPTVLSKDEQIRCFTAINRTIGVLTMLGIPEAEAEYWDDFLIRNVEFLPAEPGQAVVELGKVRPGGASVHASGNPLLYDPNASRPGTAGSVPQTRILVQDEISTCRITLQNPYDIPVDVESIDLVTDSVDLRTTHQRFTLGPRGIRRISIYASPASTGSCKVTGCLVKIQGCRKRVFPIVSQPWSSRAALFPNEHGAQRVGSKESERTNLPVYADVGLEIIEAQPTLTLHATSLLDSSLMLLDGEVFELPLTLRNTSRVPASVFNTASSNDAVQLQEIEIQDDSSETSEPTATTVIPPGENVTFTFDVIGKHNVNKVDIVFSYSCNNATTQYARILTVPITVTVNAALQVQRLDALPLDIAENGECSFVLAFDVGNAWPKPLFYSCFVADLKLKSAEPRRCHNHEGVLAPGQIQRVFMPVARSMQLTDLDDEPERVRSTLLERLRIYWEVEAEARTGWVDLSGLAMGDQVREVVVGNATDVYLKLLDNGEGCEPGVAKVGSFVTLRANLANRASRGKPLIVQVIAHSLHSSDPAQMERRIAISGAQHRLLPPIAEGMQAHVDFDLCPLLRGIIELEVVVKAALAKDGANPLWTSHKKLQMRVV